VFFSAIEKNKIIPLCEQNSLWFQEVQFRWEVPPGSVLDPMSFQPQLPHEPRCLCSVWVFGGLRAMLLFIALSIFWPNPVFASGEQHDLHSYEWIDFQRQVSVLRRDYCTKTKKRAGKRVTGPARVMQWFFQRSLNIYCRRDRTPSCKISTRIITSNRNMSGTA